MNPVVPVYVPDCHREKYLKYKRQESENCHAYVNWEFQNLWGEWKPLQQEPTWNYMFDYREIVEVTEE